MLWRTLTIGFLLTLSVAAGGTASPAAQQPANGRIAFGLFGQLVTTNPDGTGQWPLTPTSNGYVPGDWSPDGTALAVARFGDIYLVDPRGRVGTRLTFSQGLDDDPSFSPDGSKLLFESRRTGRRIWVMNADGSSPRQVTDDWFEASDPEWSPDGSMIAFTGYVDGPPEIYVMNADGTDLRRLTRNVALDQSPSWSPDGSRIAFDSSRDGSLDIYTMASDGSDARQLTTSPAIDAIPEWSPDGTRIAFMSERSGTRALFVMDASGTDQMQLSVGADTTSGPAWQPLPREPLAGTIWGPQCTIWGTETDDLLVGTPSRDVICGLGGNDRIIGGEGPDALVGGPGDDSIVGGPNSDIISAGPGDDLVDARDSDRDTIEGGDGRNVAFVDRELDRGLALTRAFDPDPGNLTRGRPVRASSTFPTGPAEYAVDGHTRLLWGSGYYAPQWIEVDIGRYATVGRIQLVVAQTPAGATLHVVLGKGRSGRWRSLASFSGETHDGQVLRYTAPHPWQGIRWVRVVTRKSPSWIAWKEIQAYAP